MSARKIHDSLARCLSDWHEVISDRNFIQRNQTLAWPNSQSAPYQPEVVTFDFVRSLVSDRQFSCLISEDSSVLQLRYEFDGRGKNLVSATLAYYGNRSPSEEESLDDILYERFLDPDESENSGPSDDQREALALEILGTSNAPAPWIRIDYAPADYSTHLHAKCHMHGAGFSEGRLALTRVPSPRQFVEFAIGLFHKDAYLGHRFSHEDEDRLIASLRHTNDLARFCDDPGAVIQHAASLSFPVA